MAEADQSHLIRFFSINAPELKILGPLRALKKLLRQLLLDPMHSSGPSSEAGSSLRGGYMICSPGVT